jgi:hypothetical protein
MPTVVKATTHKVAVASFTTSWDEAIALHRALPKLRKQAREAYRIDNLEMRFVNPWRGPDHTEFNLAVELAKGATAAAVGAVTKWLLDMVREFLKDHRKKHPSGKPKQKRRSGKRMPKHR